MRTKDMIVPRGRLPEDECARAERLRNYFHERLVSTQPHGEGWRLSFDWPRSPDFYIDPGLHEGLRWWVPELSVEQIPLAVRSKPGYQMALSDAWTLYSWSNWLTAHEGGNRAPGELVVLHADDHNDLMSPRLRRGPSGWVDMITGRPFRMNEPASVLSAITSGAVGMGSFIVPFAHHIERVHIRHLLPSATGEISRQLKREFVQDDLLCPGALRPSVELVPASDTDSPASTYLATPDPTVWVSQLPAAPILLHIDLDYLNNRFNGDSDWEEHGPRYDPGLTEITRLLARMFDALVASGCVSRIVDITIAISPAFFPAEFWPFTIQEIDRQIRRLGLDQRSLGD